MVQVLEVAHLSHLSHLVHLVHLLHVVHLIDLVHLVHLVELIEVAHLAQLLLEQMRLISTVALDGCRSGSRSDMLLVAATRVGVVVDARVSCKLVGSAKSLRASRELASVRLLSSVRANVSRLVLESVECLVAQRALVRAREVGSVFVLVLHGGDAHGHCHSSAGHRRLRRGRGLRE